MADVQRQFEQFHAAIRVDFDMSSELREKRDIVLRRLRDHLAKNNRRSFRELLQGSYTMKTGVKPTGDLEYDIDIGLRFGISEGDYDARTVRRWILEAVEGHTRRVEDKGPCIRVVYHGGYHLDLVAYAVWTDAVGLQQFRLAHKTLGWRPADPPGLLEHVTEHRRRWFDDTLDGETQTDQFRRCVRYLRRWNDTQLPGESEGKPSGLALVLLAIQAPLRRESFIDDRSDDRRALADLARVLGQSTGRLTAVKPTPEYEDVLAKLTDADMRALKTRFLDLAEALDFAGTRVDPVEACQRLTTVLGDDFPVPSPEETGAKTKAPAIVTSSSSA